MQGSLGLPVKWLSSNNYSNINNLVLYEFFGDNKYIIGAHDKIQNSIKVVAPENAKEYLPFSIRRKIVDFHKTINNI